MSVTIATATIPNWQRDSDVVLRIYALNSFVAADGTEVIAGDASVDAATNSNWFQNVICTVASGGLTIPTVTLPSTTDSPDNPKAAYAGFFFTSEGDFISPYGQFVRFTLTPTPAATTWDAIAALQSAGSSGSVAPSFFWAGTWNAATAYTLFNVVNSGDSAWIAVAPSTNVQPGSGTSWARMVQAPAGAQGLQGIPGPLAAGAFSPTAFAGALLPSIGNRFNPANVAVGQSRDAVTGVLSSNGNPELADSGLVYCPGATLLVTNAPVRNNTGGGNIVWDGASNPIAALDLDAIVSNNIVPAWTAIPLPGTQTYVSLEWAEQNYVGDWAAARVPATNALGQPASAGVMIFTGTTANPPIVPTTYQTFGVINSAILAAIQPLVPISSLAQTIAAIQPVQLDVNTFDYKKVTAGESVSADASLQPSFDVSNSTLAANSVIHSTAFLSCAGMNNFSTNIPFILTGNAGCHLFEYDANFKELGEINPAGLSQNDRINTHATIPLSGNQSYIRGSYAFAGLVGQYDASGNPGPARNETYGQVIFGTTASPALLGTGVLPFPGNDASPFVKRASQLGCMMNVANNSDTTNPHYAASADGSTVVDDTARINAFLSLASATQPVKLIMDGIAAVTGVVISSAGNTCIEGLGLGTGFYQLANSDMDGIRIGAYAVITADQGDSEGVASNRANIPARVAQNIVLRDFTIGGQGNTPYTPAAGVPPSITTAPNRPATGDPSHQTYSIILANCTNVSVENVNVYNGPSFSLCLGNVGRFNVERFTTDTTEIFHDGIHVNGPAEDGAISNCHVNSGDDAIALNACEGYGGIIQRVTVTNCTFNARAAMCRIYTGNTLGPIINGLQTSTNPAPPVSVKQTTFSGCVGSAQQGFNIGIGTQSYAQPGQIEDLIISSCSIIATQGFMLLSVPYTSVTLRDCIYKSPTTAYAAVSVSAYSGADLMLAGCSILRDDAGNTGMPFLTVGNYTSTAGAQTSHYNRITVDNCRVVDQYGSSYAPIPYLLDIAATVDQLNVNCPDLRSVTALLNPSTGTANITTGRLAQYAALA